MSSSSEDLLQSSTNDTTDHLVVPTNADKDVSPEELVRRETRAVSVIRMAVFGMLVTAAVATCWFLHRYTSHAEVEAYETAYEGISTRIVESFVSDTNLKMWMGKTMAAGVEFALRNDNVTKLTLDQKKFEALTQEARYRAYISLVAWSPWLETEEERMEFEDYASGVDFTIGPHPQCAMCGSLDQIYSNPNFQIQFPGYAPIVCANVEVPGRIGTIPADQCAVVTQLAKSLGCECGPIPEGVVVPTNILNKPSTIYRQVQGENQPLPLEYTNAPYSPIWQVATFKDAKPVVMIDQLADPYRSEPLALVRDHKIPTMGSMFVDDNSRVRSHLYYPVLQSGELVGTILMENLWGEYYTSIFPIHSDLVHIVVETTCSGNFTFVVDMESNTMKHVIDVELDYSRVRSSTYAEYDNVVAFASPFDTDSTQADYCQYRYHVHSSQALEDEFISNNPWIFTSIAAVIFVFTSLTFCLYDVVVSKRQEKVMESANQTNDIVTSLFPQNVRDRLFEQAQQQKQMPSKKQMHTFLENGSSSILASDPIADLFPSATVMFLDIAGFTAWCSERDPSQVFRLLETLYQAFDEVASTLGVFKVETIGDSYVAVCGLPEHRENHAVVMAKFAQACLQRMQRLTAELEIYLGPSTGDLQARVGLHSGPVTAGVLRGEKARFQLFGDTVNTASRMESSGAPHRIHASKATADLLIKANKGRWVEPRERSIHVKGKGEFKTYWIAPRQRAASATDRSASGHDLSSDLDLSQIEVPGVANLTERNFRLVGK